MIINQIEDRIGSFTGDIGIYYMDLTTNECCFVGNKDVFPASGMVKLMTLIEAHNQIFNKTLSKDDVYTLRLEDFVRDEVSYGAIDSLHPGIDLTIADIYRLSISVSDNIAFNILLGKLGMTTVNETFRQLGYKNMIINRSLFDNEKIKKGIENYISIKEMGKIMQRLYMGQIISKESSQDILDCLSKHQRNNIIPYHFSEDTYIAHLSAYDEGLILDSGIVFADNPFLLSMGAFQGDTRKAEGIMRDITLLCYNNSN